MTNESHKLKALATELLSDIEGGFESRRSEEMFAVDLDGEV